MLIQLLALPHALYNVQGDKVGPYDYWQVNNSISRNNLSSLASHCCNILCRIGQ